MLEFVRNLVETRLPSLDTARLVYLDSTKGRVDGCCVLIFDPEHAAPALVAKAARSPRGKAIFRADYENLEILDGEIVHDMPAGEWRRIQRAKGYDYILVNGEVTIDHAEETHNYSGKLLRHGAM